MTNKECIPAFIIRAGNPQPQQTTLLEVLNFIDSANPRQSRIILYAMRQSPWYALNQMAYAFDGFAGLPGLSISPASTTKQRRAS